MQGLCYKLHQCDLRPQEIYFGGSTLCWLSIKHMSPALNFIQSGNILRSFHRYFLPKLRVNQNYPICMVDSDPAIGGLWLIPLEMEQGLETNFQLITLLTSHAHVLYLIRSSLELLQIEVVSVHQKTSHLWQQKADLNSFGNLFQCIK